MPFRNLPVECATLDGRNFTLLKPLIFTDPQRRTYRVPIGATSDGLSIPQVLWTVGLPPFGEAWLAGVLHDAAYRDQLEVLVSGTVKEGSWSKVTLAKDACDTLFHEAILAMGVDVQKARLLYEGVHLGGQGAFDADRMPTEGTGS